MSRPLLGAISGLVLVMAFAPRAEAEALYSVKDLGVAGTDPYPLANLSGRDLLRVDGSGSVSTIPSPTGSLSGASPVSGLGPQVFAPGVSTDGRYVAGTIYSGPVPGPAPWVAFSSLDGQATSLGRPGTTIDSYSAGYGVNNSGQVVGAFTAIANQFTAFLDTPGKGMISLGTLGGPSSSAFGINNAGVVVGQSSIAGGQLYDPTPRAFLDAGQGMVDLNTLISPNSGFLLTSASGINDAGQIATYGNDATGATHLLLLTPNTVPEPGPLALLTVGLIAGAIRRYRR